MYIKIFISQSFTKPTLKYHFVASYFVTILLSTPLRGRSTSVIPLAVLENVVSAHEFFLGVAFDVMFCPRDVGAKYFILA